MQKRGGTGRNRLRLLSLLLVLLVGSQLTGQFSITPSDQGDTDAAGLQTQFAQLPLAFEPNRGQVDSAVQYLVHHGQATTYFTGTDTVTSIGDEHVTMSLMGAGNPIFAGSDELPSKTNYFIGNDQSKWQSNISNFQSILAQNVYPGIDLKYYGANSQLEHDFIVSPGIDPSQIAFKFAGQKDLSLDEKGNLILRLKDVAFALQAPISYQETENGNRKAVTSSFELKDNKIVSIVLGEYDVSRELVIDPTLSLINSTYLGGTGDDTGYGITVDPSGNTYIIGYTESSDFPTSSPYQGSHNGSTNDVFVSKLNPQGTALVYSTYLGGTAEDFGYRVAADINGNAYIVGATDSSDFPTNIPFQAIKDVGEDGFVAKLNADGSTLMYSTYLGGDGNDNGYDIAVDSSGSAYVSGETGSSNFPTAGSPFQSSWAGQWDSYVTKFSPSGTTLMYSTYLGGSTDDNGIRLAIDISGNAFVTGKTDSTDFPTNAAYQGSHAGGVYDSFVALLDATGSNLTYSTYLGGTGDDIDSNIDVDSTGNAYISGTTTSTDFPTSSPYQGSNAGGRDVYVSKLTSDGSALTYSTYLGGTGSDGILMGIAVNSNGDVYVSSTTNSSDFPLVSAYQSTPVGGNIIFVTKINSAGSALSYSTYLDGGGEDRANDLALGSNGNAYITGLSASTDLPTYSPFQGSNAGGKDAFITQISENTVNLQATVDAYLNFTLSTTVCDMGHFSTTQSKFCTHTMSAATNAVGGYTISYIPTTTLTSGANTIDEMSSQTSSVLASEQFGFNLMANTSGGSNTAANFGADPAGGSGYVLAGYELADQFQFLTGGDNIAESTTPSLSTMFTASYIANITLVTEPGTYATPVTYNIVGSF